MTECKIMTMTEITVIKMNVGRWVIVFASGIFAILLGYTTYILAVLALHQPLWPGLAYGFLAIVSASVTIFIGAMTGVAISWAVD